MREDDLPGPQGDRRKGEGITPDHIVFVFFYPPLPGGQDRFCCEPKPAAVQEGKGDPGGEEAVGVDREDHARGEVDEEDDERITAADEPVQGPVFFEEVFGELGEAGQQGEDGGEDVDIEGRSPDGVMDIVLFVLEEAGIVPEGGVVDDDPEHEEGDDAEDEVDEEAAQDIEAGSHYR